MVFGADSCIGHEIRIWIGENEAMRLYDLEIKILACLLRGRKDKNGKK